MSDKPTLITRRCRHEILYDLLRNLNEWSLPTKTAALTGLQYVSFQNFIQHLIDRGFVETSEVGKRVAYKRTELAEEWLSLYSKLEYMVEPRDVEL